MPHTITDTHQRTLPLSRIITPDGFNPRTTVTRDRDFAALVATIRRHGVLQPIRVRETGSGDFALIAGERRYAAALEACLTEIPAVIRPTAGDTPEEAATLLVEALIENDMRVGLSCVERAHGYARLKQDGLSVRGIAEQTGRPQRYIREHLQILDLPTTLHEPLASGQVPFKAVPVLRTLAKAHPELPAALTDAVIDSAQSDEPWRWDDAITRPLDILEQLDQLPDGVYGQYRRYTVKELPLTDQARRQHASYVKLTGRELTVSFGPDDLGKAAALGATLGEGRFALIIGDDVAAQLVADDLTTLLRDAKKRAREQAKTTTTATEDAVGVSRETDTGPHESEAEREARQKAARAAQREADQAARRTAEAFNERLGAALVHTVSRVKVDTGVIKVLTTVSFGEHIAQIAMRGARYGFPGWFTDQPKGDGNRREYLGAPDAHAKATEYLAGAQSLGEHAGRVLALLCMAALADQNAVAMSNRIQHPVHTTGTPWAHEVIEILDNIAGQALANDEHLTTLLTARQHERDAAAQARRRHEEAQTTLTAGLRDLDTLHADQVAALQRLVPVAYEPYTPALYNTERRLRDRLKAIAAATDGASNTADEDIVAAQ